MSKHIAPSHFYCLPSGLKVHPCRLILKDGTLMWKHALLYLNHYSIPSEEAHEQHVVKTAQRLEELNSWVSNECDETEFLTPSAWYVPDNTELSEGIATYFTHSSIKNESVYDLLKSHVHSHEVLEIRNQHLFFQRC